MEGGALFNPGFIGGSFIWWLGQIADNSSWRNNEEPGKFENATQVPGFGKRYKVRIIGVHDKEEEQIKSDQLPWATIMYPVTAGGGQGGSFQTANLRQGMFVFGFWMDGQDMQVPIIMGVLGNNALTALNTKIGNSETNFAPTSGWAQGQEDIRGTAKSEPRDADKSINKPKPVDTSKEEAILSGKDELNKYGLPEGKNTTPEQQRDLESAKASIENMDPKVKELTFGTEDPSQTQKDDYIKNSVTEGIKKRVQYANSPGSPTQAGATIEGTGSLMQVGASDVKLEDKYQEKTVLVVPDEVVESSIKAMQTITDNLTKKVEKHMGALGNYADAVSGAPTSEDLQKMLKDSACAMSKYMKVIMDKMMEYSNKTLNEELTETVSSMPSCKRHEIGDMMNVMNEKSLEQYNKITDKICGKLENILSNALNLGTPEKDSNGNLNYTGGIIEERKKEVQEHVGITTTVTIVDKTTGKLVEREFTRDEIQTHPNVPMCSAEDIIGTAIAEVKTDIDDVNNLNVRGVSRYIEDVTAQLERMDVDLQEKGEDASKDGAVLSITDAEVLDNVLGGTKYKTMVNVGTQWRDSTIPDRKISVGFTTAQVDGQGLVVDITVPTGGLGGTGSGSIDFTWVNQGTGYPATGTGPANAVNCLGGSGTGMKVNLVTTGGAVTNMFTHTTGTGYKVGEEMTIQAGGFDAKFKLDAVWGKIQEGGIKVNKRGVGYVVGDVYTVLGGSGDGTFMIVAVDNPGDGKADASSPKPQQLGSMIPKIPTMGGNLTSALNFKNITANIFPFELPPNASPVDFVTLANGGEGQPDRQKPSMDSIRKVVSEKVSTGLGSRSKPFLTPTQKGVADLVENKVNLQDI